MRLDAMARWWRLAPWATNDLMRRRDRLLALTAIAAIGGILGLLPVCATIGAVTYSDLSAKSSVERSSYHRVDATVTEPPIPISEPTEVSLSTDAYARVGWTSFDGAEHTARAEVPQDARRGQTIGIWVDDAGNMTRAPRTGTENAVLGVCVAFVSWTAASAVVLGGVLAVWVVVRRAALVEWDREWRSLERHRR